MAAIQVLNEGYTPQAGHKLMVGSLDVKALYPNLDIPYAAEKIAQEFYESSIEILDESVDTFQLGLYLVLTCSEEELIANELRE